MSTNRINTQHIPKFDLYLIEQFSTIVQLIKKPLINNKNVLISAHEANLLDKSINRYITRSEVSQLSKTITKLENKGFVFDAACVTFMPNQRMYKLIQRPRSRLYTNIETKMAASTDFIGWFNFNNWNDVLTLQMKLLITSMINFKEKKYNYFSIRELQCILQDRGYDVDCVDVYKLLEELVWLGFDVDWKEDISSLQPTVKFQLRISRLSPLYNNDAAAIGTWRLEFHACDTLAYEDLRDGVGDWFKMCDLFTSTYGGSLTVFENGDHTLVTWCKDVKSTEVNPVDLLLAKPGTLLQFTSN